jgi:hypothetical protein
MRYSDPAWIGRLKLGADINLWVTLLLLIAFIVEGVIAQSPDSPAFDLRILAGVIAFGMVGLIISMWLMTDPDPSGIGERAYGTSRRLARWSLLGMLGTSGYVITEMILHLPAVHHGYVRFLADLLAGINLIGFVALLNYLSKLAVRMRDARLTERCRTLCLGWALAGGLAMLVWFANDFLMPTDFARDNDLGGLVLAFALIACLSSLVLLFVWILVLLRLSSRLNEQRRLAIPLWQE